MKTNRSRAIAFATVVCATAANIGRLTEAAPLPQVTFSKAVGDVAWYHPLGWGSVFAGRLRAGAIWGGANSNGTKQPPQQERLYAGGASSVRGFQQNELGPLLYVLDDTTNVRRVELPRAHGRESTA